MDLRLYDTLTRQKRTFVPIDPSNVRMYVCGPTVYDYAHIGNARPAIVFDVLFRLLRHTYGADHVTYVRNITDVDDKINDRALRDFPDLPLNEAIREVTRKTEAQFHADVDALGCLRPTVEPRATDFVLPRADGKTDMVTIIRQLIDRGHAYVADDEVLFDTQSMPDYGRLSGRRLDEQRAGARVAVDAQKKNAADFVLWKGSSANEPGWDSPWGRGRPGWHIECSAMSAAYLGETFDIHGGGLDLIFPHHENEIAQSRCAHGTDVMANYWMHNGFLQVEGEKMSKSTGNFVTIRELLRGWKGQPWSGPVVRWAMLQTHYRQPMDWTFDNLILARDELWRILMFAETIEEPLEKIEQTIEPSKEIVSALSDDLSTSDAIFSIRQKCAHGGPKGHELMRILRDLMFLGVIRRQSDHIFSTRTEGRDWPAAMASTIGNLGNSLRIARANDDDVFEADLIARAKSLNLSLGKQSSRVVELFYEGKKLHSVEGLIDARTAARANKDFAESDRIRDELLAMGVTLKDGKDADGKPLTTWEIAR